MAARSRSRTRGGYKQRLGLPHRRKSRPTLGTPVPVRDLQKNAWATRLATKFSTNKASATEAQEDAALSMAAGAQGVQGIARIGNSGRAVKNCSRDLRRLMQKDCTAPLPYLVTIPITDPKKNQIYNVDHPVLLPHEMMEYIIQTGTATVEELANVDPRQDQNLQTHKRAFCATHGVPARTCIPIGFHGDGVPFQKSTHKNSNTEVYSWIFGVTGMASAICLPIFTRSSSASVVVQAGAPWRPCLQFLFGPCRSFWVVTTPMSAMMGLPWILPGPSQGAGN